MSPQRTCIGCRLVCDQAALVRYALVDGVVTRDPRRLLPGRGVWLHDDQKCREMALRKGGFARGFRRRVSVPEELFDAQPVRPEA